MNNARSRLTYANVMSTFAAVVALGAGSAYAATQLPVHSVGTKQLANSSVTGKKVRDGSLRAKDFKPGQLPTGQPGAKGPKGDQGIQGLPGANAAAYLGSASNISLPSTAANTCFKGTLTEPGIKTGDTVIIAPDYAGTFPIAMSVVGGISNASGTIVAQFCNNSTGVTPSFINQTVAIWRVVGPTP